MMLDMRVRARRWMGPQLVRLGLTRMAKRAVRLFRAPGIPTIRPKVLRAIPHDRNAHTQGLAYVNGHLYESTGTVGASSLRRIDIHTGQVLQAIAVPGVWAEGIAASDWRDGHFAT